jgi:hypothetical protein
VKRYVMKQRALTFYTEELKKAQARLTALTEQGTGGLSRFDIAIGYESEIASQATAEEALQTVKRLVRNDIASYTKRIAKLKKQPTQLSLFSQAGDTSIKKRVQEGR